MCVMMHHVTRKDEHVPSSFVKGAAAMGKVLIV
jgi:hypothetical protein